MFNSRLFLIGLVLGGCAATGDETPTVQHPAGPPDRTFRIRYEAWATDLPQGRAVDLWIPVPRDDPHQRIRDLQVTSDLPWRLTREPRHGNRMLHLRTRARTPRLDVNLAYTVDRWVHSAPDGSTATAGPGLDAGARRRYLAPARLVVVDGEIRRQAATVAPAGATPYTRARAYARHILAEMTYGKPAEKPWGRGDTRYAMTACVGNCTDFHSWFLSLCRAAGIPARFQIGLFGSYDRREGQEYELGGYHCWAQFLDGKGRWVPVDLSEADKIMDTDRRRAEWFFGNHTANRVTLSTGRDLVLEPAQRGAPLNYFLNPYVEVDGKAHAKAGKRSWWRDLRTGSADPAPGR